MANTVAPNGTETHQESDEVRNLEEPRPRAEAVAPGNEAAAAAEAEEPDIIEIVSAAQDADIFLYSGELERVGAEKFLDAAEHAAHRKNAFLILSTYGGDPDAAYIIAKYLKRAYSEGVFRLYIFGACKSAGTLLALGADEIVMSHRGEFGPLDIQLVKADEIFFRSSGLDIMEGLEALGTYAFTIFEKQFIQLLINSSGAVSTRTAGEIATSIAVGLLAPITAQIDPLKLGEMARSVSIAIDYGERLRANRNQVMRLVMNYSSHSFVIDFDEAREIFGNKLRSPDEIEVRLEHRLQELLTEQTGYECIRKPFPGGGVAAYLKTGEHDDELDKEEHSDDNANTGPNADSAPNSTDD